LLLQSADCGTQLCEEHGHIGFNSSRSSTFSGTSDELVKFFGIARWEGHQANESIGIGDLRFPSVPFLLADYIVPLGWLHWYYDYDGVLGLSPQSPAWIAMQESGLLEENIIGLKFPSGPIDAELAGHRDDGELVLGGISPDFSSAPFTDLPLAGGDSALWWATPLQSLSVLNKSIVQPFPLPEGQLAGFVSADPFITLPAPLAEALMGQVWPNATGISAGFPHFPCEMRDSLVDVIVSLGEGDLIWNLTISPYDYSVHVVNRARDIDNCLMVTYPGEYNNIVLGWPILRRFYTVFDNGRKLIRCKPSQPSSLLLAEPYLLTKMTVTPKPDID